MNICKYAVTAVLIGLLGIVSGAQNAQAKQPKKAENKHISAYLEKANKAAKEAYKQEADTVKCVYCHQPMDLQDAHRHCPALDCTGICTSQKPAQRTTAAAAPCTCACCGHVYTQEEQFGHEQHQCNHQEAAPKAPAQNNVADTAQTIPAPKHCIYCGKEITGDFQVCTSPDRLSQYCTTHCPECGKDLRDPKNVGPDGTHHCRGKLTVKVAPVKK